MTTHDREPKTMLGADRMDKLARDAELMSEMKRGLHPHPNSVDSDDEEPSPISLTSDGTRSSKRKRRRRLTLAVLPTVLTLGNGVCGLAAIAVATSESLVWSNEKQLLVAGILIFGGMLFDALDGSAARMTGQESRFGGELDSLCDAITFGTAPAVLVWRYNEGVYLPQKVTWAIGTLFALCVLIRLARFNVETGEDDAHDGFEGLPSPAAAGTLAAFAIAMPELAGYADPVFYNEHIVRWTERTLVASHYLLPGLALILAYLMVSRFQYPHVFQQLLRGRRAPNQIGQGLFVVIGVSCCTGWLSRSRSVTTHSARR